MRSNRTIAAAFFVSIACAIVGAAAPRAWAYVPGPMAEQRAQEGLVPLEQVFAMLRRQTSGKNLDAHIRRRDDIVFYEIEWLTAEGRKLVFVVDARTGTLLSTRGAG